MTSFDGWDTRIHGNGPAGGHSGMAMVLRDAPGWSMSYRGTAVHGAGFGRGHYRGDMAPVQLYGTRGTRGARTPAMLYGAGGQIRVQQKKPSLPTQGIVGGFEWGNVHRVAHSGMDDGIATSGAFARSSGVRTVASRIDIRDGVWTGTHIAEHGQILGSSLPSYEHGFEWRSDTLMHFRTKGSKNGVRRYQTEDGTWTPLGLRERRAREGFGEGRAARKEARAKRREERSAARAAERSRRAEELRKFNEKRRASNPKTMTDEELRAGIERKKLEKEYRELNRNPLLTTAGNLAQNYMKNRAEAAKAKERQYQSETNRINALANLRKAQAENRNSKASLVDSVTGAKRMEAKTGLIKSKTEWSKHTIRGAIMQSVHDILAKEGARTVREMGEQSLVMRGGRKVKSGWQKSLTAGKRFVTNRMNDWAYGKNTNRRGGGPNLN